MTSQPSESPSHRIDVPCGDDDRTTQRDERGPRDGTPYAAPPFPPGPAYPVSTPR